MEWEEAWVRFSYLGLSPRRQRTLLEVFGSPQEVFRAPPEAIEAAPGMDGTVAARVRQVAQQPIEGDLKRMREMNIRLVVWGEANYPPPLATIEDPPCVLYLRGEWRPQDERAVALVGTRNPSVYGRLVAEELARELARQGITVISGLARGIDTAAHEGALQGGGRTLGVKACGLDVNYPRESAALAERMVERGALLSEYPLGTPPEGWRFPARNRIISGLARGVVVVEAPLKSGALITADFALEQGREVMAVPGPVNTRRHEGCHRLIKEGAHLVESIEDVLSVLGWSRRAAPSPREGAPATPPPDLPPPQRAVWEALTDEPQHVDTIIRRLQRPAAEVNAALVLLEMRGLVQRLPGQYFQRAASGRG